MRRSRFLPATFLSTVALILLLPLTVLSSEEIVAGDEMDTVLERLGPPSGSIGSDRFRILYYERGEIHLRNDVVEAIDLISEEEARLRKETREAQRLAAQEAIEEQRKQRIEEGERRLAARLEDPAFLNAPAEQRLAFFTTFQRNYPEVDVSFERQVALSEVAAKRQELRLAQARENERRDMERRMWEAEERAAKAEREALQTRRAALQTRRAALYPYRPITVVRPIIIPRKPHDKPKPPKKEEPPPGVDAVFRRGGVNIHYRSDYENNRAHIQGVTPISGNAAQRVDRAVSGTAAQRVDSAFRTSP